MASVLLSPRACYDEAFRGFLETVDRDRPLRRKYAYTRAAELAYAPEA